MATLPTFLKAWNFSKLNQTITYVSLNDTMATLLFGVKDYLVTTMGASVVFSSNGTTGPSSGADATDRWSTKANATTRGANTTSANSWIVIQWAGVQFCMSYVGASDDVARLSFSQGSLFTVAGTATHTPTATDEVLIASGPSIINSTASANRVYSISASTDRTVFRCYVFRQGVTALSFGLERFQEAPGIIAGTVLGWNCNIGYVAAVNTQGHGAGNSGTTPGGSNFRGVYYAGAARPTIGGTVLFGQLGLTTISTGTPEWNGGQPLFPVLIGSSTAGNGAWLGTRYDLFAAHGSQALGDVTDDVGANTRAALAGESCMTAWDPAQGVITS